MIPLAFFEAMESRGVRSLSLAPMMAAMERAYTRWDAQFDREGKLAELDKIIAGMKAK